MVDDTLPDELDTDDFQDAWALWVQHRKECKKTLKTTTKRSQLKRLAGMGAERATLALAHSIEQGYQGIYEPTEVNGSGSLEQLAMEVEK